MRHATRMLLSAAMLSAATTTTLAEQITNLQLMEMFNSTWTQMCTDGQKLVVAYEFKRAIVPDLVGKDGEPVFEFQLEKLTHCEVDAPFQVGQAEQ